MQPIIDVISTTTVILVSNSTPVRHNSRMAAHSDNILEKSHETTRAYKDLIMSSSRSSGEVFRGGNGFQRSQEFLELLNNPQDAVPTIHIAGTSGKGSVSAILDALLIAHGKNTGRYNSPHVYDLLERWRYNGEIVDGHSFSQAVSQLPPAISKFKNSRWKRVTYFETTTAVAFLLFKRWGVDYAIVETGLGGLYDTTNTIKRPDKLAIITQLGLDHTDILGGTIDKIASQKAGILPIDGQAIVLKPNDPSAKNAINEIANERNTEVTYIEPLILKNIKLAPDYTTFDYETSSLELTNLQLSLIGEHQATNASLALSALELLSRRDSFTLDASKIRQALRSISLPGRFEQRAIHGRPAILDGAHNPQKISALVETLKKIYPNRKFTWLVAFGKTKDADSSLKIIAPLVNRLIVTTFFADQDMKLSQKANAPQTIANSAKSAGVKDVVVEPDNSRALKLACQKNSKLPIIIAGSFFLIGEIPN